MTKEIKKVVKSAKSLAGLESKNHLNVQLINGTFGPAEAADILLSFINDKIKFHTVKKLHSGHVPDVPKKESDNRIYELKTAKGQITDLVLRARKDNMILEIDSTIQIKLKKRTTPDTL